MQASLRVKLTLNSCRKIPKGIFPQRGGHHTQVHKDLLG
jgi:hypothetical protein